MFKKLITKLKNYFLKPTTKVYYLPSIDEIITVTEHKTVEVLSTANKIKVLPKQKGILTYYQISKLNPEDLLLLGDL